MVFPKILLFTTIQINDNNDIKSNIIKVYNIQPNTEPFRIVIFSIYE
jgi:hypothetical protein